MNFFKWLISLFTRKKPAKSVQNVPRATLPKKEEIIKAIVAEARVNDAPKPAPRKVVDRFSTRIKNKKPYRLPLASMNIHYKGV